MNDSRFDMTKLLSQEGIYADLFDISRIVEAQSGRVLEIREDGSLHVGAICTDLLGSDERCKSCISCRAVYSNEHSVKIQYAKGAVYLVMAIPIVYNEKPIVVELIKNISSSLFFEIQDDLKEAAKVPDVIEKFNRIAVTDSLTQLLNRRFIDEKLPVLLSNSIRIDRPVSLAILDVDFFKNVNDTYGHQAGDAVLKKLSEILATFIRRDSDFVARYGGEEFLFCFPGTPLNTARFICERVRARIEKEPFFWDGKVFRITISIGVAESREVAALTQETIIELADDRLYRAKNSGRNKVM